MIAMTKWQRKAGTINFASNEIHQPPRDLTSVFALENSKGKRTPDNRVEKKRIKEKTLRKGNTVKVLRYADTSGSIILRDRHLK